MSNGAGKTDQRLSCVLACASLWPFLASLGPMSKSGSAQPPGCDHCPIAAMVLVQPDKAAQLPPSSWIRYELPREGPPPKPAGSCAEVAAASGGPYHCFQPQTEKKTDSSRQRRWRRR